MKCLLTVALFIATISSCNSPMPITANPDDHTTTTGTVGSAQMTNKLPEKAGKDLPVSDTLRPAKDSLY